VLFAFSAAGPSVTKACRSLGRRPDAFDTRHAKHWEQRWLGQVLSVQVFCNSVLGVLAVMMICRTRTTYASNSRQADAEVMSRRQMSHGSRLVRGTLAVSQQPGR
jgi:hypothetical protein